MNGRLPGASWPVKSVCVPAGCLQVGRHVDALLPSLADLLCTHAVPSVRLAAVEAVQAAMALPYPELHPHRALLLRAVTAALDDPRRVVRLAAVRCRHAWATG